MKVKRKSGPAAAVILREAIETSFGPTLHASLDSLQGVTTTTHWPNGCDGAESKRVLLSIIIIVTIK